VSFVLDASVALLWLALDTNRAGVEYANAAVKMLKESQALVPSLWPLEVGNVIAKLEVKNVVTEGLPLLSDSHQALPMGYPCARQVPGKPHRTL
jgi:hypothetical protein